MTTTYQGRAGRRGRTIAAILLAVGRDPSSAWSARRAGARSRPVHRAGPRIRQRESARHDGRRFGDQPAPKSRPHSGRADQLCEQRRQVTA